MSTLCREYIHPDGRKTKCESARGTQMVRGDAGSSQHSLPCLSLCCSKLSTNAIDASTVA